MPAGFSRKQVADIAALAQLELDDAELETFGHQLAEILAYVAALQELDTSGVPPTASVVTRHGADRPDAVRPSLAREEALAAAPDPALDEGLFKVPRVIG